jgi:hypothetical protein
MFNLYGIAPGSERLERFILWPTGVLSPGAMRQWGRHAVAFVGKRHFDDVSDKPTKICIQSILHIRAWNYQLFVFFKTIISRPVFA